MSIWILAAVLAVLLGVAGYFLGGVRASVTLIGTLVGIAIADMIREPVSDTIIPKLFYDLSFEIGSVKAPFDFKFYFEFWRDGAAPIVGALLVSLVFLGIGFAIHHVFAKRYTNRATDIKRIQWTKMTRSWGLVTGLVSALVWVVFISNIVYFPGYATNQLTSASEPANGLGLLNSLRKDLVSTGMADVVAPWDDTHDSVYEAIDFAGVMYVNPRDEFRYRLAAYPLFLGKTRDGSALTAAVKDSEINDFFSNRGDIVKLYSNSAFKDVINSQPLSDPIENFYPDDIRAFLETGISTRTEHRIVRRWRFDPGETTIELRRFANDIPRSIKGVVQRAMMDMKARIVATPEGQFFLSPEFPNATIAALSEQYSIESPELVTGEIAKLVTGINREMKTRWEANGHEFTIGEGLNELTGLVVNGDLKLIDRDGRTYVFYPDD